MLWEHLHIGAVQADALCSGMSGGYSGARQRQGGGCDRRINGRRRQLLQLVYNPVGFYRLAKGSCEQ